MSIFTRILGLSDPKITAAFQDICGIKVHQHDGANSECNGGSRHKNTGYVAGTSSQNGSACQSNGCESLTKTQGMNGHAVNHFTDISKNNHVTDDCLKQRKSLYMNGHTKPGKNGHGAPNGVSNHLTCDKLVSKTDPCENKVDGHTNGHAPCYKNTEDTRTYSVENYLLYYIFSFGASLGNEVFYIIFFSTCLWNFDSFVTRKMLILWGIIMYLGQALKDIVRWPRPDSPPAIRLETRYELEYGMPSTHAMVAVAIPFGMLIFMVDRYEFNLAFGVLFAVNWCILVSFSRLYLGMHSALDIVAGVVFATILMGILVFFVDAMDAFLIHNVWGGHGLLVASLFCCVMYPSLDKWSTARGDTTTSVAVFSGIVFGIWMTRMLMDETAESEHLPFPLDIPSWEVLWMCIQRQTVGVIIVVIILNAMRKTMLKGMCNLWGLDPADPKSKQTLRVELPYKYVSYFTASMASTYLVPIIFQHLNIMRQSFYSECLL